MNNTKNTDSKWDWIPCTYNLKKEINGKTTFWNLSPSIILTNPSGEGPDPNVKLFIDTEKSLQYSNELGWNWHKSWNLPNISLRLEIKDSTTQELLLCPKNLYAHLFAVKAVLDHSDNFHLVDVGLRGVNRIELLDGHAFFSAIKFASTSYNNEGVKFHLVLSLYIMSEDDDTPKVLNSTISPPIFVDSRKSARDSHVLLEKKMSSFVEPFLPESLEKLFIKRENKRKNDIEIQILNDFEGLFNYLTAPNIRHKVKHPLFLHLKFSNCVQLYVNNEIYQRTNLEGLIETLQKKLCEDHYSKRSNSGNIKLENKLFILLIEESSDSFKNKKITEAVEPLQCNSLEILFSQSLVPPNFKRIENNVELLSLYKKNYATLFATTKLNKGSNDENGNKRESSDSEGESEEAEPPTQKKLKVTGDYNLGMAANYNEASQAANEESKEEKGKSKQSESKANSNGFKATNDSAKPGDSNMLAKGGNQAISSSGAQAQPGAQQAPSQSQQANLPGNQSKLPSGESSQNKFLPNIPYPTNLPNTSNLSNGSSGSNIPMMSDNANRNILNLLGSQGMANINSNPMLSAALNSMIASQNLPQQQSNQMSQNMNFFNQYLMGGQNSGLGGIPASPLMKNAAPGSSQSGGQSQPQSQSQPQQPQQSQQSQQQQQQQQQHNQQLLNMMYQQGMINPQILQQITPELRDSLLKPQGKSTQQAQQTPQSQGFGGLSSHSQGQAGLGSSQQSSGQSMAQQQAFANSKPPANLDSIVSQLMSQSGNSLGLGPNRGFPPGVSGLPTGNPFSQLDTNNPFPYKQGGMINKAQNQASIPANAGMSNLGNGALLNLLGGMGGQANPQLANMNPMYLMALQNQYMKAEIKKEEDLNK